MSEEKKCKDCEKSVHMHKSLARQCWICCEHARQAQARRIKIELGDVIELAERKIGNKGDENDWEEFYEIDIAVWREFWKRWGVE